VGHSDTTTIQIIARDKYGNERTIPDDLTVDIHTFYPYHEGLFYYQNYGNLLAPDGSTGTEIEGISYGDARAGKVKFIANGETPATPEKFFIEAYLWYSSEGLDMSIFGITGLMIMDPTSMVPQPPSVLKRSNP